MLALDLLLPKLSHSGMASTWTEESTKTPAEWLQCW